MNGKTSMTGMARRETSAEIDAAASLWAVRVEGAVLTAADEAELAAWLAGDTRRLGAYARACAMLARSGRLKALGAGFDPDRFAIEHGARPRPAVDDVALEPELADWSDVALHPTRRKILVGGSAAAAVAAAAAIGFAWPAAATVYSTRRGEIRLVPLEDGSSMTLNTQTTARVLFTSSERHIELVEGEILFDVVRDARRPFVVQAGASRVKAASTSFTISRLPDQDLKVTVRQGSVQLAGPASPRPIAVLTANTRALVASATATVATSPVAPSELSRDLAWRQGMLSFEDAPLSQAAAQFARYSDTAILFDDPAIGRQTITGLYAASDPQGFARAAALSLGLKTSERPGAITLGR
jgi:transmembrane sensor